MQDLLRQRWFRVVVCVLAAIGGWLVTGWIAAYVHLF